MGIFMLFCLMALRLSGLPIVGRIKRLRCHPTGFYLIALTGDPATAQNSSRQSPVW
ncbi:Uncharacterised protein [Salmonella enterica subsp. enterica]|uniref:Uncharacterized protein n=1 Tax=Salmonella enterica I TaxID=59201 RepID=A0A3S4K8E7_SALET|nr:Uncharacterised protein [Salmonella enterica subsp. enterica serovar Typhimurium str. DT104]CQG24226.1 Uncharacterised protein [Salmonella enterica subsp. enterica serovar Typhimurium str. DT104]VEB56214.1 Uncharacterised protein [Salmonella enterica subsp. enterica]VFS36872.1 Uncharacterised protein [Salmonella enterica subsp. enterica serovar Typhimurium]